MTTLGRVGHVVQVDHQVDCGLFDGREGGAIGRCPIDLTVLKQPGDALVKICLFPIANGLDQ